MPLIRLVLDTFYIPLYHLSDFIYESLVPQSETSLIRTELSYVLVSSGSVGTCAIGTVYVLYDLPLLAKEYIATGLALTLVMISSRRWPMFIMNPAAP